MISPENQLAELLSRAQQGDSEAFTALYNLYFDRIYRFIFYRTNHQETAEDLAEDVFVKAYKSLPTLKELQTFESWLYQIARNLVIDHYRSRKQTIDLAEVENSAHFDDTIVDQLNLEAEQKIFLTLLSELPAEQQQVIRYKFLEELENDTIAGLMQKSEGAIRVIQHRAITRLKELAETYLEDLTQ
jgi:RNA polymerase sigma-70 factor (ECF subfamily)